MHNKNLNHIFEGGNSRGKQKLQENQLSNLKKSMSADFTINNIFKDINLGKETNLVWRGHSHQDFVLGIHAGRIHRLK